MHWEMVYKNNDSMINYLEIARYSVKTECDSLESESVSSDSETSSEEEEESQGLLENRILSGYWGVNRFEDHPWSDRKQPTVRTTHFKDIKEFTREEDLGILSQRIIAMGLSYLEKSPYDLKYAYCKCKLQDKNLTDISALRPYHYIQYLNLSYNNIQTLAALSEMPYLQFLDASFNLIDVAFDFRPPFYLTKVNYAGNNIASIPNLAKFWSLVYLDLSKNRIHEIKGLETLKYLTYLDLSENKIRMIENLNNLNLETLLLRHNSILMLQQESKTVGFHTLKKLRLLDLSFNKLKSVNFLRQNYALEHLFLNNNDLTQFLDLLSLGDIRSIKSLDVKGNGIASMPHFRSMCIRTFKKVLQLNKENVTAEEKVKAYTKEDWDPSYPAHNTRTQLLLLEQLKRPNTGAHVCPFDEPHPNVIVIVGPPGSKKRNILENFVDENDLLQVGVTHTTRPQGKKEICGMYYYFIQHSEFATMLKNAEFLAISEFNGYLYGITHEELSKGLSSILVFISTLETALILRMAGINPEIVLALPRDEEKHMQWVKDYYIFHAPEESTGDEVSDKECPACSRTVVKIQRIDEFEDFDEDVIEEPKTLSETSSFILDEESTSEESMSRELKNDSFDNEVDHPVDLIYKPDQSDTSLRSTPFEMESQKRVSLKLIESSFEEHLNRGLVHRQSDQDEQSIRKSNTRKESIGGEMKHLKIKENQTCRYNAISFASKRSGKQYKTGKYKFGKKVSFNWSDMQEEDGSEEKFRRSRIKSISNAHLFAGLENRYDENPLLSVLSSSRIPTLHSRRSSKTVYTSLSERLETLKAEKLSAFYEQVLETRNELLELHYQNPGLFNTVIFTDELQESISILRNIAKTMIQNMKMIKDRQVVPGTEENLHQNKEIVKNRLKMMKLFDSPFKTIYDRFEIE